MVAENKYCTITIRKVDAEYLDVIRQTDKGEVSYSKIIKKVLEAYRTVMD